MLQKEQIFKELKELEEQKSKRGIGVVGTQAQVGKTGEGKGSSQDFKGVGSVRGQKVVLLWPQTVLPSVLARPLWRMAWMKQRPRSESLPLW